MKGVLEMSVLRSIWNENFVPSKMSEEDAETAYQLGENVSEKYEALVSILSDEAKKLLGDYVESFEKYELFLEATCFESGFKTAIQLLLEGIS